MKVFEKIGPKKSIKKQLNTTEEDLLTTSISFEFFQKAAGETNFLRQIGRFHQMQSNTYLPIVLQRLAHFFTKTILI